MLSFGPKDFRQNKLKIEQNIIILPSLVNCYIERLTQINLTNNQW